MVINGTYYRDQIDISTDQFWEMFDDLTEQPSTTAVNSGDFLTAFREAAKTSDSIICILVSKILSATQESAYMAKRMIKSELPHLNIEIVDSKAAAGAMGFIVLECARAVQQNKSLDQVLKITREMVNRVVYLATLDTLKYLIKIGRAPKSTPIGEMLQLKPIVGFIDDTGLLDMVTRVRGKQKAIVKMVDLVDKYIDTDQPVHAVIHYSDGPALAEEIKQMITSKYNCAEIFITRYTPVMLCATGPTTGIAFYS